MQKKRLLSYYIIAQYKEEDKFIRFISKGNNEDLRSRQHVAHNHKKVG